MLSNLANFRSGLLVMLALLLAVSACGRKGGLEAPPSELSGFEEQTDGKTAEPAPKPDKPFILDPLL